MCEFTIHCVSSDSTDEVHIIRFHALHPVPINVTLRSSISLDADIADNEDTKEKTKIGMKRILKQKRVKGTQGHGPTHKAHRHVNFNIRHSDM